jgi:hypothetical protein
MAAVVREISDAQGEKWVHKRLLEWAPWARCASPGTEGTSEGYLRERTDPGHPGEPTAEIARTDKAVAKMRVERKDYWRPLAMFYLEPGEISEYEISLRFGYSLERTAEMLRQARILIGYHLRRGE